MLQIFRLKQKFHQRMMQRLFLSIFVCLPLASAMEAEVGYSFKSFDYKEDLPAPLKSTESAVVLAPYGQLKFFTSEDVRSYFLLNAELAVYAQSKYDGTNFSGEPAAGNNTHHFFDTSADYYLQVVENFYLIGGLGYHYWDRFLSGGSGYREIYSWGYYNLGIAYRHAFSNRLEFAPEFMLRQMFMGNIYIIFSETVENGDNTSLPLGNKLGYFLKFPVHYQFAESVVKLAIKPFYAFSQIGSSEIKYNSTPTANGRLGNIQEPSSRTHEFGVQVGLSFPLQ